MNQKKTLFSIPTTYQSNVTPDNLIMASDRIEFIKNSLNHKSNIETREDQIEKYNYLMELLHLHEHYKLLTDKEVQSCFDMASNLIKLVGSYSRKNSMGIKYSELYSMRSKIEHNNHQNWRSYWSSLLTSYTTPQADDGEQHLILALRSMRLFQGELAERYYDLANHLGIPEPYLDYYQIQRIRFFYLTYQVDKAAAAIHQELKKKTSSELIWHKSIVAAIVEMDLTAMRSLCMKGGRCYNSQNILLFYGWALSIKSRKWVSGLVPVHSLRRRKAIEFNINDMYFKSIAVLQECYDFERPLIQRLEKLGNILDDVSLIESEEQELLVWAGAIRWLWRTRAKDFAKACLTQYHQRCLSISHGRSHDVLNLMKDIKLDGI